MGYIIECSKQCHWDEGVSPHLDLVLSNVSLLPFLLSPPHFFSHIDLYLAPKGLLLSLPKTFSAIHLSRFEQIIPVFFWNSYQMTPMHKYEKLFPLIMNISTSYSVSPINKFLCAPNIYKYLCSQHRFAIIMKTKIWSSALRDIKYNSEIKCKNSIRLFFCVKV